MNELQKDELKVLETSFRELKESVLDNINPTLLSRELGFMNPIAINIKQWSMDLYLYYINKKKDILDNPDSEIDINFDEVGMLQYDNDDLVKSISSVSMYKIANYIDKPFTDIKINQVDFKRDLKADIVLNKKVTRSANGRPIKSEYFLVDELMAVIYFDFKTDSSNLIVERTETLYYIKKDNTKGTPIIIKQKKYDLTNPTDAALAIKERVNSRKFITEAIMVFINGVLQQYHPDKTQYQIILMTLSYWNYSEKTRLDFINLGLEYWEDDLRNMVSPAPDDYAWLDYTIDDNGTSVKDYMIAMLSY